MKIAPLVVTLLVASAVSSVTTYSIFVPSTNQDNVSQILQKRGGKNIPSALLTSEGVKRSFPNLYENHLDLIRLSFVNKSPLEQSHREISEVDLDYLLAQRSTQGVRVESKTGQMFTTISFGAASGISETKRSEFILLLSSYGGWCYTDESDGFVCDIPSIVEKQA